MQLAVWFQSKFNLTNEQVDELESAISKNFVQKEKVNQWVSVEDVAKFVVYLCNTDPHGPFDYADGDIKNLEALIISWMQHYSNQNHQ